MTNRFLPARKRETPKPTLAGTPKKGVKERCGKGCPMESLLRSVFLFPPAFLKLRSVEEGLKKI